MTGKPKVPKAATVAALLRELRVLRRPYRDRIALQSQYSVALGHFAKFLAAEGANDEALKIVGLAGAIGQLRNGPPVADVLQPASFGSGRGPDGIMVWSLRHEVVIGLKCILMSGKMKTVEAAEYIADNYPDFDRLKRSPKASLAKSILAWRRRIDDGDVPEEAEDLLAHERRFFERHGGENRSPAEMFGLAKRLLAEAAERTTKSVF
jgi:hypothetical protein